MCFRSHYFISWRNSFAQGANIQNLRFNEIGKIEIPIPQQTEKQKIISNAVNVSLEKVEVARLAAEAELAAIEALPAAILRKAFNGEL